MEGPSLVLLKEEIKSFKGKRVIESAGLAQIDQDRLIAQRIKSIRTWGKHLLIEFRNVTLRIHFLMFGSYRMNDIKEGRNPSLHLAFADGAELNFYTCAIKEIEGSLDDHYDWAIDVMNDQWDAARARKKLKKLPALNVGDALLSQEIFAGVGNIIKNEVLFRIHVHPDNKIGQLPPRKLTALVTETRNYSFDFYRWKKVFQLKKHWQIYTKKKCPRCKAPTIKKYTGLTKRRTFFCKQCQQLY